MGASRGRTLLGLHALLALYSLCSICGKLASGFEFMSPGFVLCYGGMILVLGLYAIGWQQVIKRMPLTSACSMNASSGKTPEERPKPCLSLSLSPWTRRSTRRF